MSAATKYHISRVVVALSVPGICYSFSRMIPAGLNGDTSEVKRWFAVAAVIIIAGVVSVIVMSYNKLQPDKPGNLTSKVEILAATQANVTRQRQAAAPPTIVSSTSTSDKLPPPQGV